MDQRRWHLRAHKAMVVRHGYTGVLSGHAQWQQGGNGIKNAEWFDTIPYSLP